MLLVRRYRLHYRPSRGSVSGIVRCHLINPFKFKFGCLNRGPKFKKNLKKINFIPHPHINIEVKKILKKIKTSC
jgi:hypothetical protein